ncbi:NAD(P)H-hydrate dehydratase [Aliarcobacter vitoriensis]|uniref:NAD(P)H-hydrate epimerase n=1 Tax=Aliarcobacter vitoriensis TaxID=2011099 RepID=A0A366MQX4_9BACT|nr:NAD(P)H-hydrate dehydratase [Aliarcobacter vitoriensis]RBQ28010.1 bifunctional ADP-dependent NAD(P)H-hydrate dehydratase/NAD(P)H-hydrate epimerase [Aliarcobacter vitoriensis]
MQKIFDEVNSLDKRSYEKFFLTEDILMEHAAFSIYTYIENNFKKNSTILIICGSGNNGADGLALARLLYKKFDIKIYLANEPKSSMAKIQYERIKSLDITISEKLFEADILIDCLFGTGLNRSLDENSKTLISKLNSFNSFKIACDIPSGINNVGQIENIAFKADVTITMGALKLSLFSDVVKDFIGDIQVSNLGIQREIYETQTNKFLLELSDINLPFRDKDNSHKGTFGHTNIIIGTKTGAGIISCDSAFAFGCGLVTAISKEDLDLPYHIMQDRKISKNCTSIAIGMGLGEYEKNEIEKILETDILKVIDADLFYEKLLLKYLDDKVVLTPHPKEFISLLKLTNTDEISIEELQNNRFLYVEKFCKKYPKVVLLLKGANVIIAQNEEIFINNFGRAVLSKGGSGDVLSGLIASLLAQGYDRLEACITASLAHTTASNNYPKNNYSLSPQELIEEIKKL